MWRADLQPLDVEVAFAAFDDVRKVEKFRPTWAAFLEAVNAKRRVRDMRASFDRGLPSGGPTAPTNPTLLRLVEVMSATADAHDHRKGNLSCPVCRLHDHDRYGVHLLSCARCGTIAAALEPTVEDV